MYSFIEKQISFYEENRKSKTYQIHFFVIFLFIILKKTHFFKCINYIFSINVYYLIVYEKISLN